VKKKAEMSKSRNIRRNSSSVSIWKADVSKVSPNANQQEKLQALLIDIDGLRSISRIVEIIKQKIAAGERNTPANDSERHAAGDSSGSTTTSSN